MDLAKHRTLAATLGSLCAVVLAGSLAATASAAAPKPLGHACNAQNGVRFCPTTGSAQRVPTWDGVPLDVDVTLPASLKANVRIRSDNGEIYSDFDIALDKNPSKLEEDRQKGHYRVVLVREMTGKIGGGGPEILFKTFNGDILLRRAKD